MNFGSCIRDGILLAGLAVLVYGLARLDASIGWIGAGMILTILASLWSYAAGRKKGN